jgi:hypothetical protein
VPRVRHVAGCDGMQRGASSSDQIHHGGCRLQYVIFMNTKFVTMEEYKLTCFTNLQQQNILYIQTIHWITLAHIYVAYKLIWTVRKCIPHLLIGTSI